MALDETVRNALETAVREARQPPAVTKQLLSWYEALYSGNETLEQDRDDALRRLARLYDAVSINATKHRTNGER